MKEVVVEKNRSKALSILFLAILGVGSAAILVRSALAPALTIAFWRVFLAGLLAILIGLITEKNKTQFLMLLQTEYWKIILAGVSLALHFWLWFESLRHIPVAVNIVLVDTTPIWLAIISFFFLKVPISKKEILGITITLFGISLFAFHSNSITPLQGGNTLLGIFLAIISSWIVTIYLLVGRNVLQSHGLWLYFGTVNLVSALTLAALALVFHVSLFISSLQNLLIFVGLALGPSIIGHAGFNYSIRTLKPTTVGLGILGETVIATILSIIILHEIPNMFSLFGAAIIVFGITLSILEEAQQKENESLSSIEP